MKDIKVKEVMIPIANYIAVKKDSSLIDVLQALEAARSEQEHAHRDAIVVDDAGELIGKITMIDIFRSLEPNYKNINMDQIGGILTNEFVMKIIKDFNLWMEPLQDLCERGAKLRVGDVMHTPEKVEYIDEN